MYDIFKQDIISEKTCGVLSINPPSIHLPFLESDQLGLNFFKLNRSSDVITTVDEKTGKVTQEANYNVYIHFMVKLGIIGVTEYSIKFE